MQLIRQKENMLIAMAVFFLLILSACGIQDVMTVSSGGPKTKVKTTNSNFQIYLDDNIQVIVVPTNSNVTFRKTIGNMRYVSVYVEKVLNPIEGFEKCGCVYAIEGDTLYLGKYGGWEHSHLNPQQVNISIGVPADVIVRSDSHLNGITYIEYSKTDDSTLPYLAQIKSELEWIYCQD